MNIIKHYERVQEEMEIAQRIQRSLIPVTVPSCNTAEVEAYLKPSVELGGDFYDYYEPDADTLCMVLGDVSGNGIPAALHMAEMKGIFQTLAQFKLSPRKFMMRANTAVGNCFRKHIFVTLVYMVLDRKNRTITYARAGHCPVLYYNAALDKADYIKDEGLGLGIVRNDSFEEHIHIYQRKIYPGDVYVMLTDGFEEALSADGQERYGADRLKTSLERAHKSSAKAIKKDILADFEDYVKGQENLDDLGLMILRVR